MKHYRARSGGGSNVDKYSNEVAVDVTMSALNTLTFQEIDLGLSLFDRAGILISRLVYTPVQGMWAELTAEADNVQMALGQSNQIASIAPSERSLLDQVRIVLNLVGTGATAEVLQGTIVHDFSQLAGGGMLVTPRPLYIAMVTSGFAAASGMTMRMYFTVVRLKDADYFELLETRRFLG